MDIRFDDAGFSDGRRKISWDEIRAIGIRTTADGPWSADLFWLFMTSDGPVELPGALIDGAALDAIQQAFPTLDHGKLLCAMGSTDERIWRIWHVEEASAGWDDARFADRFAALVGRLGGTVPRAGVVFARLVAAWRSEGRRYHDLEHLMDCLRELDGARAAPGVADVAEFALWYHDAVYQPLARDNEARSASRLREDGAALCLPEDCLLAASACVLATAHLAAPNRDGTASDHAADLTVDADLAILGRDPLRFMEFEYAVAEEYAAVSRTRYFFTRGRFLDGLTNAPMLFRTRHFRQRYEAAARANLAALLASPRYAAYRRLGRPYRWIAGMIARRCPTG